MEAFNIVVEQLENYWTGFVRLLPQIGFALVTIFITAFLASFAGRILSFILGSVRMRSALKDLLRTLFSVVIWIVGLLLAAVIIFPSITPAQLIGALGVGSIAVGLAFRDIFENFMSGIMIMARKPMRIGDIIEINDIQGRVEEITIRDTHVRKLDDELVLLPNSMIFKNAVSIKTDKAERRHEVVVGVAYGENAAQAKDLILKAVEGVDTINTNRGVEVYATQFGSSSIDFVVRWWAGSTPQEMHKTRSDVIISIKAALDDANIEIPFPYRTLTFTKPLQIANAEKRPDSAA